MSAPEMKARPVPVRIVACSAASPATSSSVAIRPSRIGRFIAFSFRSRLTRMIPTGPSRSKITSRSSTSEHPPSFHDGDGCIVVAQLGQDLRIVLSDQGGRPADGSRRLAQADRGADQLEGAGTWAIHLLHELASPHLRIAEHALEVLHLGTPHVAGAQQVPPR